MGCCRTCLLKDSRLLCMCIPRLYHKWHRHFTTCPPAGGLSLDVEAKMRYKCPSALFPLSGRDCSPALQRRRDTHDPFMAYVEDVRVMVRTNRRALRVDSQWWHGAA